MKSILLVEDSPFLIEIYAIKIKEAGFLIDIAVDGEECLKKIREKLPDLILLDIVLPKLDGWEILKAVKDSDELKNIKVVILSNLGRKEEVEKGIKLGAASYLIKSQYTPSQVVEEIKKILK